jgi:hypothetical protein
MTTLWLSNLSFTGGSDELLLVRKLPMRNQFEEVIADEQKLVPTGLSIAE